MGWAFVIATILLAAPSLTLSKGAFVGVFTSDGQSLPSPAPTGERWVSYEQVQRELQFRRWVAPLTNNQMAELAAGLEADFAVDILTTTAKVKGRWQVLSVMRVVSASLGEIVHLEQVQTNISSPDELPQVVGQIVPSLLTKFPSQLPTASVQLREGNRRVHLIATSGKWRRGTQLLFFREIGGQRTFVGKGRIVAADLPAGGSRWLLEANLTEIRVSVRAGDKAIQVFKLPKPFEKWQ
ncbi:MAG: hypothetical protein RMK89_05835 [Armatimonadota bacterium]|nr:hypothetical protein [Armatimonadota bacterium]MDW8142968.1 hypothetical protein [Armatimonadota bacterium]